jgi:hypothetical protein
MSQNLIKCTNGIRFRNVTEKLFNSPAFKRTDWRKVEEVEAPPQIEQKPKQSKARKVESPVIEAILNDASEFESLPDNDNFTNL